VAARSPLRQCPCQRRIEPFTLLPATGAASAGAAGTPSLAGTPAFNVRVLDQAPPEAHP
jgi:hypothetical protein